MEQSPQQLQYQPQPVMPQPSNKPHYLIAGIIIVVLVVILGWFIYKNYLSSSVYTPPVTSSPSPTSSVIPTTIPGPSQTPAPTPNVTVTWRGQGVPMADLGLITYRDDLNTPMPGETPQPISYYDMGTNGSNKIILAKAPAVDPSGPSIFFFEQTSNIYSFLAAMSTQNTYRFMAAMSTQGIYTADTKQGYSLSSRVTATDTTTFYSDVIGPNRLSYHGLFLYQPYIPLSSDLFSNYVADEQTQSGVTVRKLDTIDSGDMYIQQIVHDQLAIRKYILKLKSGLYAEYNLYYSFISDNQVPAITWTSGTKNTDSYHTDAALGGCGNPGATVVPLQDISTRIQQTGTTSDGQAIYEFNSQNDPLVKYFYSLSGKTYNKTTGQYEPFSLQEFWNHHAVILYKNGLGDYVIFTSDTYGVQAECGKPVIYLYPTQTTNIHVQVGADITASEPTYGNGWNVQAQPDGKLTTSNGQTYDSLYWEGMGQGNYPAITEGTIISRSKITETLKSQLVELGLSEKESADFLEFWLPKMPATPYTRLTWFTTDQVNKLAPLVVWPRPDTTIRVFLDFQGLENPITLPAQHLTTIPRRGFTLIEWGGLLKK